MQTGRQNSQSHSAFSDFLCRCHSHREQIDRHLQQVPVLSRQVAILLVGIMFSSRFGGGGGVEVYAYQLFTGSICAVLGLFHTFFLLSDLGQSGLEFLSLFGNSTPGFPFGMFYHPFGFIVIAWNVR